MSDYHRLCMRFALRKDTPQIIIDALQALATGKPPLSDEVLKLPEVYHSYLSSTPMEGDETAVAGLLAVRMSKITQPEPGEGSEEPIFSFYYEAIFHDDEWANWGSMFADAMFQFAAEDGYVASFEANQGDIPEIYLKDGDDMVIVRLEPSNDIIWPLPHIPNRLDPETPVTLGDAIRYNLKDAAKAAEQATMEDMF